MKGGRGKGKEIEKRRKVGDRETEKEGKREGGEEKGKKERERREGGKGNIIGERRENKG